MKDKKIRVAVVLSGRYEYEEAQERLTAWTVQAARAGAKYICFPEYYFDRVREEDESYCRGVRTDGLLVRELTRLAVSHGIAIVAGVTEKKRSQRFPDLWDYYNSALFIDRQGLAGVQRKVFLWVDPEWNEDRRRPGNEGGPDYPHPPLVDERKRFLPGWSYSTFRFGGLQRAAGIICADALMPPAWSHLIPLSPQIVFNLNSRMNLLEKWGPDLGRISREYALPIVASNGWAESQAGIFDSDGSCVARLDGSPGVAVAEVTLAGKQNIPPVVIRHWDGDPLEMLERLDRW
ncbi:MAG: hypothetical protein A3F83_03490 [Candidatus Glassbacteria bacterium RIFCSPLOWO2_12_FULL_58_11]|uniref:CN hydrolase domain-containing protein n=1 Tax=Candidatus Glassbacteria bacterium RIFCSPLOWO2_12_FULL_58_11 TaxID=1817867 RepID=A0A1F5YXA3_9BACT|nr:MAG: hypothetical protein A3F83_03490 [Candidatus Glassbacteria bacterium RIFCSPLOWO2_12_FULL_58_11]